MIYRMLVRPVSATTVERWVREIVAALGADAPDHQAASGADRVPEAPHPIDHVRTSIRVTDDPAWSHLDLWFLDLDSGFADDLWNFLVVPRILRQVPGDEIAFVGPRREGSG